jgi:hypothetical protein
LQTDSVTSVDNDLVVATMGSDIIPQASLTSTEQYLNDVNFRFEEEKAIDAVEQSVFTDDMGSKSRPPTSPSLLEYMRSDAGTYFGMSTRLRSSPFILPSTSLPSPDIQNNASVTDFGFYDESLCEDGSLDFGERRSLTAPSGQRNSLTSKVPKSSSSHLAPSFTEKNNYGYESYYKSVPNTATCVGVRPDHRTPIDDKLAKTTIHYPASPWRPPTPARHEPCIVDILKAPSNILVKAKVALPLKGMVRFICFIVRLP